MEKQAAICGLQRLKGKQEVDDSGFEDSCPANANAAGECSCGKANGGNAERFLLCAVAVGDKSFGRGKILEMHGQPSADDVHSDGAKNNLSRL